ncbi:MAG: hypothetical protein Q4C03_01030 [bacterium]|nr:hypothetical protein [bacterium]
MRAVRDIIREAAIRCNVGTRRQALPGGIEETAFRLLKGVVDKYNYDNLLAWTQNFFICRTSPTIHIFDEIDSIKGENNLFFKTEEALNGYELSQEDFENGVLGMIYGQPNKIYTVIHPANNIYRWVQNDVDQYPEQRIQEMQRYAVMQHIHVKNLGKINSIYVSQSNKDEFYENVQLSYKAPADYDRYSRNSAVFTYTQKSEGEWLLVIKPVVAAQNWTLKVNYNQTVQFEMDSELPIPDNYAELLIVALAHKLAIQFPRLDDAQMARLETEVRVMVDNVRTPKSEDRILSRKPYDFGFQNSQMSQEELMSGSFF